MRQTHWPGEKMFVDYGGKTIPIIDAATGEITEASNYTDAEATLLQQLGDWIGSHVWALDFFGGVPQLFVPNNLKSAVTTLCCYEPLLNQTYQPDIRGDAPTPQGLDLLLRVVLIDFFDRTL